MRTLVPPHFKELKLYKPGKPAEELKRELGLSKVVKLASNENPWGASPYALLAATRAIDQAQSYPDASNFYLKQELCKQYQLKDSNIILANGSEGVMACIIRTFLVDDDEILSSEGSFVGFYILAQSSGHSLTKCPMKDQYRFDLDAIAKKINTKTKLIYLANPNNPTGTIFSKSEFDEFYKKVPEHVLIVLDEAYYEFAKFDPMFPDSLKYRYDNVITLRTFSKAYGLAGLRIGMGIGAENLITELHKARLPFEPNMIAQVAGLAALQDQAYLDRTIEWNAQNRTRLKSILENHFQLPTVPSHANFIMMNLGSKQKVEDLYNNLLKKGVIVRGLESFGWPTCVRVSVGTNEEMDFLESQLEKIKI